MKELRSFLGVSNFCSQFIPQYASLIAPLTDILQGESKSSQKNIQFSDEAKDSFLKIKNKIAEITFRSQPDLNKEFILITDASNNAMGAVLTQLDDKGCEHMISCFSKKFVKAQMNYSTTDKELLAIEKGIEHFKHYLLGNHFILKTDHQALQYMKTASNDNSRILRIALKKNTDFGSKSWERQLDASVYAYNISFHRALNTSPYILKFGKNPIIHIDDKFKNEEIIFSKSKLIEERDNHFEKYKSAIEKGKKTVNYDLKKGDKVLVYNPPLSDKFKEKWHDGYIIKEKVLPSSYLVIKNNKEYRFNKKHVKLDTSA